MIAFQFFIAPMGIAAVQHLGTAHSIQTQSSTQWSSSSEAAGCYSQLHTKVFQHPIKWDKMLPEASTDKLSSRRRHTWSELEPDPCLLNIFLGVDYISLEPKSCPKFSWFRTLRVESWHSGTGVLNLVPQRSEHFSPGVRTRLSNRQSNEFRTGFGYNVLDSASRAPNSNIPPFPPQTKGKRPDRYPVKGGIPCQWINVILLITP